MFGTETSAKDNKPAQEAESSTRTTKSVSAPMARPGTEPLVLSKSHAAAENNGMTPAYNATAQPDSTGTAELVFSVQTARSGIPQPETASAKPELSGTTSSAL